MTVTRQLQWQDPVYVDDDEVFFNLLLKEDADVERQLSIDFQPSKQFKPTTTTSSSSSKQLFEHKEQANNNKENAATLKPQTQQQRLLDGTRRHLLLSWMVDVCDTHRCQDEVFPLAATILDKFLAEYQRRFLPLPAPQAAVPASAASRLADSTTNFNNLNGQLSIDVNERRPASPARNFQQSHQQTLLIASNELPQVQLNTQQTLLAAAAAQFCCSLLTPQSDLSDNSPGSQQAKRQQCLDFDLDLIAADLDDIDDIELGIDCSLSLATASSDCVAGPSSDGACSSQLSLLTSSTATIASNDDESGVEADFDGGSSSSSRCSLAANIQQCQQQQQQQQHCELGTRQLHLFGACCLLLASKLRQTPSLSIDTLLGASAELLGHYYSGEYCATTTPLSRDEMIDAELLILTCLKWDLASVVVANDFVSLLVAKCAKCERRALETNFDYNDEEQHEDDNTESCRLIRRESKRHKASNNNNNNNMATPTSKLNETLVKNQTRKLIELSYLMDTELSLLAPSLLAMASMAVAICGLESRRANSNENFCRQPTWTRLKQTVVQIYHAAHRVKELDQITQAAIKIEKLLRNSHRRVNNSN